MMDIAKDILHKDDDLLRAPNRKRKTAEECQKPRVIRMTWDAEGETDNMGEDVGIVILADGETTQTESMEEIDPEFNLTPPFPVMNEPNAPGAPKLVLQVNKEAPFTVIEKATRQQVIVQSFAPQKMFLDSEPSADLANVGQRHINDFDPWFLLSDEVVLYIFSWVTKSVLVRCARVSRRWNRLAFDESLWRYVDLAEKTLHRGALGRVLSRGVTALRLSRAKIHSPLYVSSAVSFHPSTQPINKTTRLQFLDLSMATISLNSLQELLAGCQYLRKLSLETCHINDTICRLVAQNRNLEVLNLCMCQGLTENGLVPLCNNLKQLESLNVGWTNMGRGSVIYLIISVPASLKKLNLSGCREMLQDDDVFQLCQSCPSLKELDLSDATDLSSKSVEHIVNQLSGLEYLALSRCYKMLPSSLLFLHHMPSLLAFDVFGMLKETALVWLREALTGIEINKYPFSSIARPTTGSRRTSLWGLKV